MKCRIFILGREMCYGMTKNTHECQLVLIRVSFPLQLVNRTLFFITKALHNKQILLYCRLEPLFPKSPDYHFKPFIPQTARQQV